MIVRCIRTDVASLGGSAKRRRLISRWMGGQEAYGLSLGDAFHVVAIEMWDSIVCVYLHEFAGPDMPSPYPVDFFKVVDDHIPEGWRIAFSDAPGGVTIRRLSFPEWADDDGFYSRLIDRDEDAVRAYARAAEEMGANAAVVTRLVVRLAGDGGAGAEAEGRRQSLERTLGERLSDAEIGYCRGGLLEPDAIEVYAFVTDVALAKRIIEDHVRSNEVADHISVYEADERP